LGFAAKSFSVGAGCGVWGVGCGVWGETIHNLRVNHTIKKGFSLTARFYIGYFFSGPEGENCQEKLTHHSPSRIFIDSS
jgi:hypothetical protein